MSQTSEAGFATTLARGLAVLESFSPDSPMLGNSAISARIGLSRPTVARMTSTLAELGYLAYDERAAKFRLGPRILTLAHPLLATLRLRQIARPLMQDFAASLPGVVSIGMLDGSRVIYLESARASDHDAHVPDIGSSLPLHQTAIGRALVSMLSPPERAATVRRIEADDADGWTTFQNRFESGIRACTDRGFCTSAGDLMPGIHAAGAPLFRVRGHDVLAVNCSIAGFRLRPGALEAEIGPRLLLLAQSIAAAMERYAP